MSKITLTNLVNLQNETTAVNAINTNNATIITAIDNTLSRDGSSPNTMTANLDMNGKNIFNLPAPATVNSPARLVDVVTNPTIVLPPTGTSGHTVPFLDGTNTWSGVNTYPANDLVIKGSSTGVTALNSANASGSNFVATFPAVTDTVTLNAATQTLTNKSIVATQLTGVVPATNGGAGTITGALKANGSGTVTQAASLDLSDFTAGSWTPVDASGASLSLVGVEGTYVKLGNLVFVSGSFTYPSTANGSNAAIGGFPVNFPNNNRGRGIGTIYSNGGIAAKFLGNSNSGTALIIKNDNTQLTNANLSTFILIFQVWYSLA